MIATQVPLSKSIARPVIPVTVALMAGIAMGALWPGRFGAAIVGLVLGSIMMVRRILTRRSGLAGPLLGCVMAGYLSIQPWLVSQVPSGHVANFVGDTYWRISGVIDQRPQIKGNRWRFVLAARWLEAKNRHQPVSGKVMVSGRGPWIDAGQGDRVTLIGRLRAIRNFANPGGFDYERFMALQAVRARVYAKNGSLELVPGRRSDGWRRRIDKARETLSSQMAAALVRFPTSTIQLLQTLLLGRRELLSTQVREAFRRAGAAHVLAVSGLHIGMVAAGSFAAARWLLGWIPLMLRFAWTRKGAALISLFPVLGYGLLAGLTPSTQRAMLMVAVFLMGFWVGRRHDLVNSLTMAGLAILVIHPPSLLSISFQLSFTAVLAIVAGLTARPRSESPARRQWGRRLIALSQVSVLAGLGTLPLVLYYFNQVSLVGVAVNLVVVPVVGIVVIPIGLIGVLFAGLNAHLAGLMWWISAWGAELVRITVIWAAQWSWSAVHCVTPNGIEIALYYALGALLLYWPRIPRPGRILALVLTLISLDAGYWVDQRFGRRELSVTVLDVGQGSANLLELPGGFTVLLDGGGFSSNADFDVGATIVAPLLWRQKIRSVDLVVLSHADSDHLNGLLYILEHFQVKAVWSNGEPSQSYGYRAWQRQIANSGIRHAVIGQIPRSVEINGARLEVLAPPPDFRERRAVEPWRDLNNNSLVLRIGFNAISFLFTGDIMGPAERALIDQYGDRGLQSTILIVPHHGSRHSATRAFLEAVQPGLALISAGWRNRFGFPHADVIQRLTDLNIPTRCTSRHGAIRIITDGKDYRLETCRNPQP